MNMKIMLCLALVLALPVAKASPACDKPNIIVILADDLGYGDLGCYGATKVKTPNLDRLAAQGMRFTDAHSPSSVCSPTRYGLLTGRFAWRTWLQNGTVGVGKPCLIEPGRITLAALLKANGYHTAAIGKWHLGYGATGTQTDWNQPLKPGPLEVGFDYHFGVPNNHNDSLHCYVENHDIVGRKPGEPFRVIKGQEFPEGLAAPRVDDQVEQTLAAHALQFIDDNHDRPFFLYYTSCTPHTHITPAAKFRGTSQAGLYGDYIQELDFHVGEILAALERHKLTEQTLIFFSSDNGGALKDVAGAGKNLNLASEAGGVREHAGTAKADARKMGHLTNGDLRGGKAQIYEGGNRIPLIVRWPKQVPAKTVTDEMVCLTDLLATTADLLGVKLPDNAGEDSVTFLPRLLGKPLMKPIRESLMLRDSGGGLYALRDGPWKLIAGSDSGLKPPSELYNLGNDLGETNNLIASQPDIVDRLAKLMQSYVSSGRSTPGLPQKNDADSQFEGGAKKKKGGKKSTKTSAGSDDGL